MPLNLLWLAAFAPLALVALGLTPRLFADRHPRILINLARLAALACLGAAVLCAIAVFAVGAARTGTVGPWGIGFGAYIDTLSAMVFALVAFIGLVVVAYSAHYLDGDPRQGQFMTDLCLTLGSVLLVIVAGNLFQLLLAWIVTSLGLNRLLLFYADRQAAVLAARKKFLVSRVGDLCLIVAMILIYQTVGSLDYASLFSAAQSWGANSSTPPTVQLAALLLAVAGLLKSAQFPIHGWLLEVMETPTPVSALLHAGIINAGGFLVLRFSPLVSGAPHALETLAIVGGITAIFGSAVMLTQTSIKVALAYSTIAQMGFMMLECGLGAYAAAALHLLAHSLYKAHAFLSSGSIIDLARSSWTPSPGGQPHPARLAIAIIVVLLATWIVGSLFGATMATTPGVLALGAVVLMGLAHLVASSIDERPSPYVIGRAVALAGSVAAIYFVLQSAVEHVLAGALPTSTSAHSAFDQVIGVAVVLSFGGLTVFQNLLQFQTPEPRWQALYAHLSNGLYVNALANRWILRWWPAPVRPEAVKGAMQ
jgi:NAD(P)H-quinone oxidoreductase subunit 5